MKYLKFFILIFICLIPTVIYGQEIQTTADNPTLDSYKQALLENLPSTRNAGRVWTDKSVFSNQKKSVSVDNHTIEYDDDFLEVYSALGSNYELGETKNSPIDLVITIDCSRSMGDEISGADVDSELNRIPLKIDETAKSINNMIEYLMNENKDNQVAVVVYQTKAKTVFPLGRYIHNEDNPFMSIVPENTIKGSDSTVKRYSYTANFNGLKEEDSSPVTGSVSTDNSKLETDADLGNTTNFQTGMYLGLKELADNKSAQTSGNRAKIINLSDGAPNTYSFESWNKIEDQSQYFKFTEKKDNQEECKTRIEELILQSIFSISYLKTAIAKNYNYPAQLIILEVDSGGNSETSYDQTIWNGILNKDDYLNSSGNTGDEILTAVRDYYKKWKEQNSDIEIPDEDPTFAETGNFPLVKFPVDNEYGITKEEMLNNISSVDLYELIPSEEQSKVFQDLIKSFTRDEFHPVETESDSEYNSVLTYEEPVGRYMEVTPRKMILFDKEYNLKKTSEENSEFGVTEIYLPEKTDSESVKNESYSEPVDLDLSKIEFRIETGGENQKVKIIIPEECIPILTTKVEYNQNYDDTAHRVIESIEDNRDNRKQSEPIRFIYGVNLLDSIKNEDNTVNVSQIDPEYLKEHSDGETIDFFTTEFLNTSSKFDESSTSGDALATFIPSVNNEFYNAQEELPVYTDKNLQDELTQDENISDDQEYYLKKYYYGYEEKQPKLLDSVTEVTGEILENTVAKSQTNQSESVVTIKPGLNCIGDLHNYSINKNKNVTDTASLVYYPVLESYENPENLVRIYLGNNGKMALPVRFDIKFSITKYQAIGENSLTKDRLTVCASDIITYELRINNLNNFNLTDVLISDTLPEGLEYVPGSMNPSGIFSENKVTWLVDFEPLEEKRVSFKVKVPNVSQADYKNFFTIEYEDNQKTVTMDSNVVEAIVESPDLNLTKYQAVNNLNKTKSQLKVNSGDYLTYFFEVRNQGKGRANKITVSDEVPADLKVDTASISDNGLITDNKITWNLEKLDPEEVKQLSFSVWIPDNSVNSHWENTAFVSHEFNPVPENSNTVAVDKNIVDISIEKLQAISNQNPTKSLLDISPGYIVTYYLKVTNNSGIIVNNIKVSDNIASDLTVIENSISNNGILENNQITWNIPSIQPGNTVQVSFQVQTPQNSLNKSWNNVATLTADELNNPIDSNIVTIQEESDLITTVSTNSTSNTNSNSNSSSHSVSSSSNNPKTGYSSNYNALIWLIGLLAVLILTGQAYRTFKE